MNLNDSRTVVFSVNGFHLLFDIVISENKKMIHVGIIGNGFFRPLNEFREIENIGGFHRIRFQVLGCSRLASNRKSKAAEANKGEKALHDPV